VVIADNLSSYSSFTTRLWLARHPHIRQVFIPVGRAGSTSRRAGGGCTAGA